MSNIMSQLKLGSFTCRVKTKCLMNHFILPPNIWCSKKLWTYVWKINPSNSVWFTYKHIRRHTQIIGSIERIIDDCFEVRHWTSIVKSFHFHSKGLNWKKCNFSCGHIIYEEHQVVIKRLTLIQKVNTFHIVASII